MTAWLRQHQTPPASEQQPDLGGPYLVIQHLSAAYNHLQILTDVSLQVWWQQVVAIVGPNGAGKTTILKAVGGLLRPVGGTILLAGEDITALPVWEVVRRGVVYVPEGTNVFPEMSVLENLEIGGYLQRDAIPARLQFVYQVFPELQKRPKTPAGSLSGGQQRMVVLARGLMAGAKMLLLDDPFLGLSPKYVKIFCDVFRTLRRQGMTLLISGQHVRRILNVADLAFLIEGGKITLTGTGPELLHNHHLQRTLFGIEATCELGEVQQMEK
ncbi:MAG: ABC transporter ATP-binding protein [Desulfobacca sp.]|uniref:ABC transporter ATP-binding protein n=1 Tax=Desulfobacca sp. TaxID=2067990 RepID=UPI0040496DC3